MIENESRLDKLQQKAKIREWYKGVDPGVLEVIPAKKQTDFYDDEPRRVAVYVRVSTRKGGVTDDIDFRPDMSGIFGDLFDLDGDGELNSVEQAADFLAFQQMTEDEDSDEDVFDSDDE